MVDSIIHVHNNSLKTRFILLLCNSFQINIYQVLLGATDYKYCHSWNDKELGVLFMFSGEEGEAQKS